MAKRRAESPADWVPFLGMCSDNLGYLEWTRRVVFKDALMVADSRAHAYFARQYAVMSVAAVEAMLQLWRDQTGSPQLVEYFKPSLNEPQSNAARVQMLAGTFLSAGIDVDPEVIQDYIALKYIRNAIAHGPLADGERQFLGERGFPKELDTFTERHHMRMHVCHSAMVRYLMSFDVLPAMVHGPLVMAMTSTPKTYSSAVEK